MTLKLGPNLRALVHGDPGEQHYTELMHLLRVLDALVQPSVKSATTPSPPAAPADGDRYIVPTGATGDWAGYTGRIARWSEQLAQWEFIVPQAGWATWVDSAGGLHRYLDGAWGLVPVDINADTVAGLADSMAELSGSLDVLAAVKADKQAIASSLRSIQVEAYSWMDTDAEVALNASGERVIVFLSGGGSIRSYAVAENVVGEQIFERPSGALYPALIEVVRDASGRPRLISAVDPLRTGPVIYGAGGSGSGGFDFSVISKYVLWILAGQSNMGGRGVGGPEVPGHVGYMWHDELQPIADPVGIESNDQGSMGPAFAMRYNQLTGQGVILVPTARGGTTLVDAADTAGYGSWGPAGTLRARCVSNAKAAMTALDAANIPWEFGGILWSLGETEAARIGSGVITLAQHDAAFRDPAIGEDGKPIGLLPYLQSELGMGGVIPFVVSQVGTPYGSDPTSWQQLRDLQRDWARTMPNVFIGFAGAKTFEARGMTRTTAVGELHYNQRGYNQMGEALATVAATFPGII